MFLLIRGVPDPPKCGLLMGNPPTRTGNHHGHSVQMPARYCPKTITAMPERSDEVHNLTMCVHCPTCLERPSAQGGMLAAVLAVLGKHLTVCEVQVITSVSSGPRSPSKFGRRTAVQGNSTNLDSSSGRLHIRASSARSPFFSYATCN
jgi:hypothetical protein